MNCTKSDFLRIFKGFNIEDLQFEADKDKRILGNYTPNLNFLNNIWEGYKARGCASFDENLNILKNALQNTRKNTAIYRLQSEQFDFLDKLKFSCDCFDYSRNIYTVKLIKQVDFDTSSIPANGAIREFVVKGDKGAVFSLYITNEDSPKKYYNFETKNFTTTRYVLEDVTIEENSKSVFVYFPKVTDDDHYDITIFANPEFNTEHISYNEVRYNDTNRTVNVNASSGSNSAMLHKKLYQYTDNTVTLSAISPNSVSALTGYTVVTDTFTAQKYGGNITVPFKITLTANAAKAYQILRQPSSQEMGSYVTRTVGSAALPIHEEDVSASTYYRWPLDNIAGIRNGMRVTGTNVTANSIISDYKKTTELSGLTSTKPESKLTGMVEKGGIKQLQKPESGLEKESKLISKYGNETIVESTKRPLKKRTRPVNYSENIVNGVETTGSPTYTNGVFTSQPGNIVFNKKQVDALKDDTIKIMASGPSEIKSLTGYEFSVSNIKAELTKPTTTTTAATTGTTISVADREGVINNVSRLTGIGIDPSSAAPTITAGGSNDGAGNWTVDASQPLESGITLTVELTGRIITITGDIEFSKIGESDVTIYFDIEQFLSA